MAQWRILVADDDPANLAMVGELLADPDYVIATAANGVLAWEALQTADPAPHLVVLERAMHGLDGIELLKRIKADARLAAIPVIMQSASSGAADIAAGVAAGAWYFLPKPYAPSDLRTMVHAALGKVEEREAAQRAQRHRLSVIELMDLAEFEFHSLEQAADLAISLAGLCPDPVRAALGLSELLVNAIEHGNLGIGYAEKAALHRTDGWESEVARRLRDPLLGARRARVVYRRTADSLSFTISDQGDGFDWRSYLDIDPERAFDPNGRGIAMARQASFSSVEYLERGNIVVATLPRAAPLDVEERVRADAQRATAARKNAGRKALKVLVVDDTETNRVILQALLRDLGFEVVLAEDGALGVEAYQREAPDIVIMDVMMPVMDGYEATRRIRALTGGRWVPLLFLSTQDDEQSLVAGLDAGGDDYLHKPINYVVLEAKLRSLARTLALQRSLDDERRRAAAIAENLVDGVITIDCQGLMQSCNPAVERIFGYARGEMLGKNVSMLMPEPYRSSHDEHIARYLAGGRPRVLGIGQRQLSGRRKNGEVFALDLGVNEMQVAGARQFVGVLHDASERVAAEQQLRDNARRLQAYHDTQETATALAQTIVSRQMQRAGLGDAQVDYLLAPAENFSGDIVAATRGPEGDLYVLLADATGHGLGAAICTLPVLSVFYSMGETGVALAWIVHEINRQLQATLPASHFVAASMLRIDARKQLADVWIGGTPDLLVLDASGQPRCRVTSSNLPLGIDARDDEPIDLGSIALHPGDQLLLYSDGLIEAENHAGQAFGYARLLPALTVAAGERLASVRHALAQHLGGRPPGDDVSIMLIDC